MNKNLSSQFSNGHGALLALPLSVITLFCFGFILMSSSNLNHSRGQTSSAALNSSAHHQTKLNLPLYVGPDKLSPLISPKGPANDSGGPSNNGDLPLSTPSTTPAQKLQGAPQATGLPSASQAEPNSSAQPPAVNITQPLINNLPRL